jgi:hypothetical protein
MAESDTVHVPNVVAQAEFRHVSLGIPVHWDKGDTTHVHVPVIT